MSDTLKLTPGEAVTILSSRPEALEVEATYSAAGKPPPHLHPAQDERFEVLEGALTVRVAGEERELAAGERLEIPRGTAHQMWNAADAPARVRWQTSPAGRTEQWFRAIDALHREGRVARNGMPGPLAFGVLLDEYRDVFRLAVGPDALVRPLVRGLAAGGRLRGHSART
jgi:quercetin dioxygenase-like cupin family protein